jgi:hypothetical protein
MILATNTSAGEGAGAGGLGRSARMVVFDLSASVRRRWRRAHGAAPVPAASECVWK